MPTEAQFRTLLKDKDDAALRRMERDPQFTTAQWAIIAEEIKTRGGSAAPGPASRPARSEAGRPTAVRIIDVDMPFESMVGFMVKWALASIPAILILSVIGI